MITNRLMNSRTNYLLFLACILVILHNAPVFAQESSARPDRGVLPTGSYSISDIENINLTNGNVQLSIPLASLPPIAGGKLSWTVRATYNSKLWNVRGVEDPSGFVVQEPRLNETAANYAGWEIGAIYTLDFRNAIDDLVYTDPPADCSTTPDQNECRLLQNNWYKVVFRTPDGSEHELRPLDYPDYSSAPNNGTRLSLKGYYKETPGLLDTPMRYYSSDRSFLWAVVYPTSNSSIFWTVYMPDGTSITQYRGMNAAQVIKDTNGNSLSIFTDAEGVKHYRDDQTNREIKLVPLSSTQLQVQYKTVGGVNQNIDINLGSTTVKGKLYDVRQFRAVFMDGKETGSSCLVQQPFSSVLTVVRSIVFPKTKPGVDSPRYSFSYNSDETEAFSQQIIRTCSGTTELYSEPEASKGMGSLSKIVLPSGATVDYSYKYPMDVTNTGVRHYFPQVNEIARESITAKKITHDGGIEDKWEYSIENGSTKVTNPDGSTVEESFYPYDSAVSRSIGGTGYEGLVFSSNRSNKVLIHRHWTRMLFSNTQSGTNYNNITVFNPVVDAEYTTLMENGVAVRMSARTFQYDYNGNLLETKEYDWVDLTQTQVERDAQGVPTGVPNGAVLLLTTTTSYHNSATSDSSSNVYAKRSINGPSPLILNAPKETVTGPSKTRFSYDGQAYDATPTLGNLTKVSSLDNQGDTNQANDIYLDVSTIYDSYGNKKTITDANGNITEYKYIFESPGASDVDTAPYGLPTKLITNPQNGTGTQTTTIEYDLPTGLVKKQTDPNGNFTEISYINQLTGQPDPFGRPGITYSPAVTINNVSHRRKVVSTYEDHLRRVTVAADLKAEGDGLLKSRTTQDQLGRTTLVEQSEDGSSFSISSQTVYEQAGRIIYQSNPRRTADASTDGWTRSTKDIAGRVIEVATFSGAAQPPSSGTNSDWTGSVTTSYYAQETTVKDQAGKARKSVVDALGRLIKVYENPEGLNLETGYTYDSLGNLTGVTQGVQTPRVFTYSSVSRLVSAFNPESGTISYQYDANGNLVLKIDPRPKPRNNISLSDCSIPYTGDKIATCYKYDGLNRLEKRRYNDGTPAVTYTYDTVTNGKGMLTSVSSSVSTTSYTDYDALGQVLGSIQETAGHPAYEMPDYKYDLAGNLTSQKYPSGRIVSTSYDNAGRISGITGQKSGEPNKTYASSYSYTAHRAVGSVKLGNDLWEHTSFNGRLQSVEIGLGTSLTDSGTLKLGYSYGMRVNNVLDATKNNGNLESQTIIGAGLNLTQSYTYDQLNRLKTFTETVNSSQAVSLTQTYDYDRWGNRAITVGYRQSQTITPTPQSTSDFNPNNNRLVNASYDNAGNLLSAVQGQLFSYDAENKMISHDDTSTVGTLDNQYSYDGDGRRVKKVTGTVTTIFVYNAMGQMVAEYTDASSGSPTVGTSYFTADHLGTPRVITNKDKVVISRHDYMPFGEEIKAQTGGRTVAQGYIDDADGVRQKFTQKERDAETGLDYFGARYYASDQGRFTSADPLLASGRGTNPQTWNRYAYVLNNPTKLVDPTGLIDDDQQKKNEPAQKQRIIYIFVGFDKEEQKTEVYDPKGKKLLYKVNGPNFEELVKDVPEGTVVKLLEGKNATKENFTDALQDPNAAAVIFIGHGASLNPDARPFVAMGINFGTSEGQTKETFKEAVDVRAQTVAIFACDSQRIGGLFKIEGANQSVIGVNSGRDGYTTTPALTNAGYNAARALISGKGPDAVVQTANRGMILKDRDGSALRRSKTDIGDKIVRRP